MLQKNRLNENAPGNFIFIAGANKILINEDD
jgi:hypothetical protein